MMNDSEWGGSNGGIGGKICQIVQFRKNIRQMACVQT